MKILCRNFPLRRITITIKQSHKSFGTFRHPFVSFSLLSKTNSNYSLVPTFSSATLVSWNFSSCFHCTNTLLPVVIHIICFISYVYFVFFIFFSVTSIVCSLSISLEENSLREFIIDSCFKGYWIGCTTYNIKTKNIVQCAVIKKRSDSSADFILTYILD